MCIKYELLGSDDYSFMTSSFLYLHVTHPAVEPEEDWAPEIIYVWAFLSLSCETEIAIHHTGQNNHGLVCFYVS